MRRCSGSIYSIALILVLGLTVSPVMVAGAGADSAAGDIEVIFLAGEGFMISCGHSKVLIDALFDLNAPEGALPAAHDHLPPDGIARLAGAGKPFDMVDAVLVTHMHDDHFTAECAARYMRSNGWAVLAGTRAVTDALAEYPWLAGEAGERLVTADVSAGEIDTMIIDGLTIYALGIRHTGCESGSDPAAGGMQEGSPCIEHIAWLVETDGCRILHLGDAKLAADEFERFPWLPGLEIDIAFIPYWFLLQAGGTDVINRLIAPKTVVLMHWNRWNRDVVVEELERNREDLPPTVIFGKAFEIKKF